MQPATELRRVAQLYQIEIDAPAQAPDAAAHKQWMNDASDAQEDFRFAVTDKNQSAAVEALTKLEALMARTEDYWTARKATDGVKLAKDTRALAARAVSSAKAGNITAAGDAFARMGATCNYRRAGRYTSAMHLPKTACALRCPLFSVPPLLFTARARSGCSSPAWGATVRLNCCC